MILHTYTFVASFLTNFLFFSHTDLSLASLDPVIVDFFHVLILLYYYTRLKLCFLHKLIQFRRNKTVIHSCLPLKEGLIKYAHRNTLEKEIRDIVWLWYMVWNERSPHFLYVKFAKSWYCNWLSVFGKFNNIAHLLHVLFRMLMGSLLLSPLFSLFSLPIHLNLTRKKTYYYQKPSQ